MSAWNADSALTDGNGNGGETFAEIVKHSVEGEGEEEEKTEEVVAPVAPAAPVEIAEEEFPELPHVEESTTTTDEDASLLAATKEIDDALAASREQKEEIPVQAPVEVAAATTIVEEEEVLEITFDPSDVLASSLSSSFSPPPPPPSAPQNADPSSNGTITPLPSAALPDHSAPSPNTSLPTSPALDIGGSPDPTLLVNPDSWKDELDARTLKWKAENNVARDKAEKKRAEWEKKRDEERKEESRKRKEDKVNGVEEKVNGEVKEVAVEKGVVEKELGLDAGAVGLEVKGTKEGEEEERWTKVGEAWKGVEGREHTEVYGDAKVQNGQIVETINPSIASDPSPLPTSQLTSQSLDTPSTPSPTSLLQPLTSTPSVPSDLPISHYLTTPGGNPPSLTLALFTSQYLPPRRRILLGLACFGINILLPFIGGMMAGFGEITAKLLQDTARDTFFGFRGRTVAGVGLNGVKNGRVPETEVGREVAREALVENPMGGAFP
ncbi:hypothetical protein BDY24DRAFT_396346 [Mrakia frigida]|uniref:uncharacterized protein n=1 Tax=Mrakia frigida TaxID=29902 RepID=UPI003FCC264E